MNPNTNQTTIPATPKSAVAAGLLGIFLGSFGAHNWYLGETKKGITHIALLAGGFILTILGATLGIATANIPVLPIFFALFSVVGYIALMGNGIWGLVEGIIILSQGDAGLAAKGYTVAAPVTYAQPAAPAASATPAPEAKTAEKSDSAKESTDTKSTDSAKSDAKSDK